MAQVSGTNDQRRTYPGKFNRVINLATIQWVAFEFTNSEGKGDIGFAAVFGKDQRDGGVHIAIVEPSVLKDMLKEPHPHIRDGIRALLGQYSAPPADLPVDGLGGAELGPEMGESG
jgi:hypothetical protein